MRFLQLAWISPAKCLIVSISVKWLAIFVCKEMIYGVDHLASVYRPFESRKIIPMNLDVVVLKHDNIAVTQIERR
jgi:hypothetical protein